MQLCFIIYEKVSLITCIITFFLKNAEKAHVLTAGNTDLKILQKYYKYVLTKIGLVLYFDCQNI